MSNSFTIEEGVIYEPHPHHRNGNRKKSQWIIGMNEEVAVFTFAWNGKFVSDSLAWTVYPENGVLKELGTLVDRNRRSRLAKFVGNTQTSIVWHGYPADYRTKAQDIPHEGVLKRMIEASILDKRTAIRLSLGQPCRALN